MFLLLFSYLSQLPSSIDIEFLELNDNPYIVTIEEIVPL